MRAPALLTLIGALSAIGASAQDATVGARIEAYALSESEGLLLKSMHLVTTPVEVRVPVSSSIALAVSAAYADARATLRNGETSRVSGPVDTRVSVAVSRAGFLLRGVAVLPTGEVVSSLEEAVVVGVMSADLMPFALTQWGTGGGFSGDVAYGFVGADLAIRLSAGASLRAGSRPLGSVGYTFEPGREIRGRIGIDAPAGEASLVSLLFGYQRFAADAYGGRNVFTTGSRMDALVSYSFPLGAAEGGLAYAGVYRLGPASSELTADVLNALGAVVVGTGARAPRTVLVGGTELRVRRGSVAYVPRADVRLVRSQDGVGQGWLASLGGRAELGSLAGLLGGRVHVEPALALRVGRLVAVEGAGSSILGWEAGATLRWEGGR
ncbi:MAG: hypothetical protein WEB90_05290 [Gemmatimonadota bacterium]